MACLGVHFALTDDQRARLEACTDDGARIHYVQEEIEEAWDDAYVVETDKAWDAIHRCLSDFPPDTPYFYPVERSAWALPEDHGNYPLKLCVLGGRKLMDDESKYFIRLIEPGEVADVAAAIAPLDEAWLRDKYFTHCKGAWPGSARRISTTPGNTSRRSGTSSPGWRATAVRSSSLPTSRAP